MDIDTPQSPSWLLASPTISLIAGALASAQGEMEDAAKDRKNPHFGSKYADLASVVQAVRAPLSKHGIAYLQPVSFADGRVVVRTVLVHKSGEWLASELSAKAQQDTPQGIGSTITYLRRYSLMAMAGIAPDDDDGEAGEGRQTAPAKPAARREPAPSPRPGDVREAIGDAMRLRDWLPEQVTTLLRAHGAPGDAPKALDVPESSRVAVIAALLSHSPEAK